MRYALPLILALLSGCVVPPGGFDDDGSGILVYPPPGEEIVEGDVVVIRNRSGEDVICDSTYLVFDVYADSADVPDGRQAEILLDFPRDLGEPGSSDAFRGFVDFRCGSPDNPNEHVREWRYTSPV